MGDVWCTCHKCEHETILASGPAPAPISRPGGVITLERCEYKKVGHPNNHTFAPKTHWYRPCKPIPHRTPRDGDTTDTASRLPPDSSQKSAKSRYEARIRASQVLSARRCSTRLVYEPRMSSFDNTSLVLPTSLVYELWLVTSLVTRLVCPPVCCAPARRRCPTLARGRIGRLQAARTHHSAGLAPLTHTARARTTKHPHSLHGVSHHMLSRPPHPHLLHTPLHAHRTAARTEHTAKTVRRDSRRPHIARVLHGPLHILQFWLPALLCCNA